MLFLGLPGVRVPNVVARFSKYDFWILWNFLDRYCKKDFRKRFFENILYIKFFMKIKNLFEFLFSILWWRHDVKDMHTILVKYSNFVKYSRNYYFPISSTMFWHLEKNPAFRAEICLNDVSGDSKKMENQISRFRFTTFCLQYLYILYFSLRK